MFNAFYLSRLKQERFRIFLAPRSFVNEVGNPNTNIHREGNGTAAQARTWTFIEQ